MMWIDYTIDQAPDGSLKVLGDTPMKLWRKESIHYINPEMFS